MTLGYRFPSLSIGAPDSEDELFVCVAFSGGGTRAAALAYGVLQALRATTISSGGRERTLLDEVDCISAVSGGSFAAAYYAMFPERFFDEFYTRFLLTNITNRLIAGALNPLNVYRFLSSGYGRSDMAAEVYDGVLFEGKTYGDLMQKRRRPYLMIGATDLVTGDAFQFTQHQFDFLGWDLTAVPISRAVAASSAFPVLLSPITLKNYGPPAGYAVPVEISFALQDRDINRARYAWAARLAGYLDAQKKPYVHLVDGGPADNLGLRAIMVEYQRPGGFLFSRLNDGRIKRLVTIVVNARNAPPDRLSQRDTSPGMLDVLYQTATIPIDHNSTATIEAMGELGSEEERMLRDVRACQRLLESCTGAPRLPLLDSLPKLCFVQVSFDALEDRARRERFLSVPTTFSLPREDVDALIAVGQELLESSPDFQKLLRSIRGEPTVGAGIGEVGNCS